MGVRKRIVRIWDVPAGGILPALVVVSAAFALGGVLGCGLAAQVGGGGGDMLHAWRPPGRSALTPPPGPVRRRRLICYPWSGAPYAGRSLRF